MCKIDNTHIILLILVILSEKMTHFGVKKGCKYMFQCGTGMGTPFSVWGTFKNTCTLVVQVAMATVISLKHKWIGVYLLPKDMFYQQNIQFS